MTEIDRAILDEVEDCITRIRAFQEAQGRRVIKYMKRARKGRAGLAEIDQFGLPIPEDFRALYWNHNGTRETIAITKWESNVFLDFDWPPIDSVVLSNKIIRIDPQGHSLDKLRWLHGSHGAAIDLFPMRAHDGNVPLVANLEGISTKTFIAFDSTLAMLRSVCAAQDAGILRYQEERGPPREPGGRDIEANQILYDPKELWDVIRPFNPRSDYWTALIAGPIDWELRPLPEPETPGLVKTHPEVARLLYGEPGEYAKKLAEKAEAQMRRAGVFDADDPDAFVEDRLNRLVNDPDAWKDDEAFKDELGDDEDGDRRHGDN